MFICCLDYCCEVAIRHIACWCNLWDKKTLLIRTTQKSYTIFLRSINAKITITGAMSLLSVSNDTYVAFLACSDMNMLDFLPLGVSWSLSITRSSELSSVVEGLSNAWAASVESSTLVMLSLLRPRDDRSYTYFSVPFGHWYDAESGDIHYYIHTRTMLFWAKLKSIQDWRVFCSAYLA